MKFEIMNEDRGGVWYVKGIAFYKGVLGMSCPCGTLPNIKANVLLLSVEKCTSIDKLRCLSCQTLSRRDVISTNVIITGIVFKTIDIEKKHFFLAELTNY